MNPNDMRVRFVGRFGAEVAVVARAPGRVNLIGEHTDYNDGFVLPIATEQETWVACAARDDGRVRVFSAGLAEEQSWTLEDGVAGGLPHWTSYVAGVTALLQERGASVRGFDALIESDVPPGGGLSSSAALEVATALAVARLAGWRVESRELVDLCRQAEHEFAGVPCGLMDQTVCVEGKPDTALLLDCRTRKHEHIPLRLDGHVVLVVDSGVRHELAAGAYARRQEECRRAVEHFQRVDPRIAALRDVPLEMVEKARTELDAVAAARSRHVVSENERTLAGAAALRQGDLAGFGRLMHASHCSLRDDYEVSSPELDDLVDIAMGTEGVLGARMTGGGFGGCIVVLVEARSAALVEQGVRAGYEARQGRAARILQTRPSRGASIEFS